MLRKMGRVPQFLCSDEGGELACCAEICVLLRDEFQVTLESTGGYASFLNGKVERHNSTIENLTLATLFGSNHAENKWCYASEHAATIYNATVHSAHDEQPEFLWSGTRISILDIRCFGCEIYPIRTKSSHGRKKLDPKNVSGYFMGVTASRALIKWWDTLNPQEMKFCQSAKFNESKVYMPNGTLSPGSHLSQGLDLDSLPPCMFNLQNNPLLHEPPFEISVILPPKGKAIRISCDFCDYHLLPFIRSTRKGTYFYNSLPHTHRYNFWVLTVGDNEPISVEGLIQDLIKRQLPHKCDTVSIFISKRHDPTRTLLNEC